LEKKVKNEEQCLLLHAQQAHIGLFKLAVGYEQGRESGRSRFGQDFAASQKQ